jgi:glycosyltransferase involved in cell wall biosynthesis
MRVALFCNDFWPVIGGVPTAVMGIARGLLERGHDVLVLTRRPAGLPAWDTVNGVRVRRVAWNLRPRLTFPMRAAKAMWQVWRTCSEWAPDAVYVHFVSAHAVYAAVVARRLAVPYVLSFRGNDAMRIAPRSLPARYVYGMLTKSASANVFCSDWLRRETANATWYRGSEQCTGVLADAVDVEGREGTTDVPQQYCLAAGRMVHKKGFDLVLRAWKEVGPAIGAPLLVVGDGPERAALEELAQRLELQGSVSFVGALAHEQLLGVLERATLCVVPSREEPYGIMVVEAQALGIPVVACAVGNIPYLIEDGVTGYLATPDAGGLAQRLGAAWTDPRRAAVGDAGRRAPGAQRTYGTLVAELEGWLSRCGTTAA